MAHLACQQVIKYCKQEAIIIIVLSCKYLFSSFDSQYLFIIQRKTSAAVSK